MEVGVRVEAEDITTGVITHTSSAYLTIVALDEDGRPLEVPPIVPRPTRRIVAIGRPSSGARTGSPSAAG